jgi:hypothetical protein
MYIGSGQCFGQTVIEYYNQNLKHYFVTGAQSEAVAIDNGSAGPGWVRTGERFRSFNRTQIGAKPAITVQRFYAGAPTNSHFYTIDQSEADGLRAMNVTNDFRRGWAFDQFAFNAMRPANGSCSAPQIPVYRTYNNGFVTGEGANHRYSTKKTTRDAMFQVGWKDEGVAFCVASRNSYDRFKSSDHSTVGLPMPYHDVSTIRAYGNFAGGSGDLFATRLTYWPPTTPAAATSSEIKFWRKTSTGFEPIDLIASGSVAGCIHPRKAIVDDFNGDGRDDIFVSCHGFDAPPYPGERNKILLSRSDGKYDVRDASTEIGFFHGATSVDVNGDGYPDVIVVNSTGQEKVEVLLNDGSGAFTRDTSQRFSQDVLSRSFFSIEAVDVDGDDQLDLVLGGHEWESAGPTQVLLNTNGNFRFTQSAAISLPMLSGQGVVLDFTVTERSGQRALYVLRTSGGVNTDFYRGVVVQRVGWPALSSETVYSDSAKNWVPWLLPVLDSRGMRLQSENGEVELLVN